MITHTFAHLPGISTALESFLWHRGICSWDDLFRSGPRSWLPRRVYLLIAGKLFRSQEALIEGDLSYFTSRLAPELHWRLIREFREQALYIDVEATGLNPATDKITVIGVYDGKEVKSFCRGVNLKEAAGILQAGRFWVTFKGLYFDLPFLHKDFPQLSPELHLDLHELLGYYGQQISLKSLEKKIGITREEPLCYLNGASAVSLWQRHLDGDSRALKLLLRYNCEDIVNLENLLLFAYNLHLQRTPFAREALPYKPRPDLDEAYDRELAWEVSGC